MPVAGAESINLPMLNLGFIGISMILSGTVGLRLTTWKVLPAGIVAGVSP